MQKDKQNYHKELEKSLKERTDITIEKLKTKNIKELKTLADLMKEKP